jgi:hypothetical protein
MEAPASWTGRPGGKEAVGNPGTCAKFDHFIGVVLINLELSIGWFLFQVMFIESTDVIYE